MDKITVFQDGLDKGYLGKRQNWWFDASFEHAFAIFDIDRFYEATYFAFDHVAPCVARNYVQCVLDYGRRFLRRDVASVLEIGCGGGWFTVEFLAQGVDIVAVEGSLVGYQKTLQRGVPPERILQHDLRQPLYLDRPFDMVLCTEVAEHIECPFASQLVSNIIRHGKVVWFSCEEPDTNQAHYHHCNEQPEKFWRNLFQYYGYQMYRLPEEVTEAVAQRGRQIFYAEDVPFPSELTDRRPKPMKRTSPRRLSSSADRPRNRSRGSTNKRPAPKIVDCFIFYNELELLEIRLEELYQVVDWFVIVEAKETFRGKPKECVFEANRHLFQKYNICHLTIAEFPASFTTAWEREAYSRNAIAGGLAQLDMAPTDVVLLSDVDDIPRADLVSKYAQAVANQEIECCVFSQPLYYYYVNCRSDLALPVTRMVRFQDVTTLQALRTRDGAIVPDGGWHFSYLGGPDRIREKIGAFSHGELDRPEYTDRTHLEHCLAEGKDLFGRDIHFRFVSLDESFPCYLVENQAKFRHLIGFPPPSGFAVPTEKTLVKLDIGSGGKSALGDDWLGVDAYVPQADIVAAMWDLPFDDSNVDAIHSSHALEHIPIQQVMPTLREWFRILKPGGNLTLRVPDLAWCLREWLNHPTTGFEMMRIFGNQAHDGEYHKCGFDEQILAEFLIAAGFQLVRIEAIWNHEQQTLSAEAVKPNKWNRDRQETASPLCPH